MKLASLALVAGGAVFGSQVGASAVQDEVRTKSLVLVNEESGRSAQLTATATGGMLVQFGERDGHAPGQFELAPDDGGWSMELRDPTGSTFHARVIERDVYVSLGPGDGGAGMQLNATSSKEAGQGCSFITFSSGRVNEHEDAGWPCYIGVRRGFGTLAVRKRIDATPQVEDEPHYVWQNVLQLGELDPIGPWEDGPK